MRIGKITESVLKRSVIKLIGSKTTNVSAAATTDCAYVLCDDQFNLSAMSTVTWKCDRPAYYAVHKAANNIYSSGGEVDYISLSVLLPVDADEAALKDIIRDAKAAADELETVIRGGHTEVTDAVIKPVITAFVFGKSAKKPGDYKKPSEGDSIVMTKWAGLEGTAVLAEICKEKLEERLPSHMIYDAAAFSKHISVREDARIAFDNGAEYVHDISQGGVFAALWELCEAAGCGMDVDLKKIPIKQETVEIVNHLAINPYQLISGGSLLMITKDGEGLLREFEKQGVFAEVIGNVAAGNGRIIRNEDEIRYLDKPQADEIHKIMTSWTKTRKIVQESCVSQDTPLTL
ncbi:MAG: hydrogenase maturation factor [Butyrivibrio sp.]|nr:hydrogenase maturation factor [Butyrivibrio sp.]